MLMTLTVDSNTERHFAGRKCCFMWSQLLLSVSVTLIVTAFTITYTVRQEIFTRTDREQEQHNIDTLRKQSIYDTYLDDISKHLLLRSNGTAEKTKLHIRAKTLNILPHLDSHQKTDIVRFLYENNLIRSDHLDLAIDLRTADFMGCQFQRPCQLNKLYLPGILADRIGFHGCQLSKAVFNGSSLVGAKFIGSYASNVQFDSVNLTDAVFARTNILRMNFVNAILVRSSFADGPEPQKVDFTNADLFKSDLTDAQLLFRHFSDVNTLLNTRFPNGTFSNINSSQLVIDGSAEFSCSKQNEQIYWNAFPPYPPVLFTNASDLNNTPLPIDGDCYFQCPLNDSEVHQPISVRHFSVLIDNGQARFNFSAHFSCPFSRTPAYVEIKFLTEELLYIGSQPLEIVSDESMRFHPKVRTGKVPEKTRFIYILIGANVVPTNSAHDYCFIDDVSLHFFKVDAHS